MKLRYEFFIKLIFKWIFIDSRVISNKDPMIIQSLLCFYKFKLNSFGIDLENKMNIEIFDTNKVLLDKNLIYFKKMLMCLML